ncbi:MULTISPECIES: Lrp/AsnC family transcriptional regulator [unclassified Agarivorans]|uniref:Lrp/AsnC family transcriptional regulator n=1 Tax=unclassified Agarivorans TaxID=2636026 RepID=UPI003D7E5012
MDKFDQKIVNLLAENSRRSIASIGEKIGLSRTAVNDRVQRLHQSGEIEAFTLKLKSPDNKNLISVYFQLTFRPFILNAIMTQLNNIPEIKQAHSLTGDTDLILYIQAGSMGRVNDIREQLSQLDSLDKLQTFTALQKII